MSEVSTKITTCKVRFSFCNVFEPRAMQEGQDKKYSVMLLIPKMGPGLETIKQMKAAIQAAAQKGVAKFGGKVPPVVSNTLKDADVDTDNDGNIFADKWDYTKGHYIINVSSKLQPPVVGLDRKPIVNPLDFKSGDYGYACINFFAYNTAGKKGVSAGLNSLMKAEDGEALGNTSTPEEDFKNIQ